jgi:hypothetical protein
MDREKEIRFQPLTDGLGFHPFADGLPYAPASKKATSPTPPAAPSTGTGATAAGAPRFAYPSAHAPSPTAPRTPANPVFTSTVADPTADRIRRELDSIQSRKIEEAHRVAAQMRPMLEIRYGLGYSFERALAFVLDSAFNLAVCASILSTALISADVRNLKTLSSAAVVTVGIFLFLCNWALIAAQEVAFGTTLGKRIFGLKLSGTGFECFTRAVLFLPSFLLGGIGIWTAVFDSRKRCWHDRMTKFQPEP